MSIYRIIPGTKALILRGVPDELHLDLKRVALERGVHMTDLLMDAIKDVVKDAKKKGEIK